MSILEPEQPRPRSAHIFARAVREHYVEPAWCSARLFEVENFGESSARLLDGSCGWGRILRTGTDAGYRMHGSDIADVRKIDELRIENVPFTIRNFLTAAPGDSPASCAIRPLIASKHSAAVH